MPVYTVHEPPRRDDEIVAHTARFQFVRDGFHWWALLATPLWMLRYRMWLELIAYLGLVAGITFGLDRLGIGNSAGPAVALLLSLLVGLEASSLRRWKLARRGFENLGVVIGEDLDIAERRFFDGWVAQGRRPVTPPAPSPFDPQAAEPPRSSGEQRAAPADIVGLFPQPEARA
jgi:uncharacterized protein DUF2628